MFAATTAARRQALATQRASKRLNVRYASNSSKSTQASPSNISKYVKLASAASTLAAVAYTAGSIYPPTLATYISPRVAPPPPDPNAPESIAYVEALEDTLQNLPALQALRNRPDADEWYETRPFVALSEERRANSLTAGALRGPGKLALPPIVRARKDESESYIFMHVGTGLCGHEGIVHGGLLATILDESLGRISILNLPDKVGVTANLNLNYKAPTRANQFLVVKTHLDGTLLVEATALFIQPRYAKLLNTNQIREVLGGPPVSVPLTEGSGAPFPAPVAVSEKSTA
ncbi:hypothetical protein QCA50_007441 [Cerrena zonata]|uniref:Thioesterase domain-containing protein n=1 Tax=Cerrena zonata TaxID=2478898 RepID=A0AAW0G7L7_9APHY